MFLLPAVILYFILRRALYDDALLKVVLCTDGFDLARGFIAVCLGSV